jgi:hypothetical protein
MFVKMQNLATRGGTGDSVCFDFAHFSWPGKRDLRNRNCPSVNASLPSDDLARPGRICTHFGA